MPIQIHYAQEEILSRGTHRTVAEISDLAVQVRHLTHGRGHVTSGGVVEVRLRERLFPVVEVTALRRRIDRTLCTYR